MSQKQTRLTNVLSMGPGSPTWAQDRKANAFKDTTQLRVTEDKLSPKDMSRDCSIRGLKPAFQVLKPSTNLLK